jgi:hypothetical protein
MHAMQSPGSLSKKRCGRRAKPLPTLAGLHSPVSLPPWPSVLAELVPPGLRSPLRLTVAASALACGLLLTGCATAPPRVIVETIPVPEALLVCRDEPAPPVDVTDRAVGAWIVDLAEAGDDCRAKLGAVRGIVE